MQLEAFLRQRLVEMNKEADVLAMRVFETAPPSIQNLSTEDVETKLAMVKDLIAQLTSGKMQHLFLIKSSPRYDSMFHSVSYFFKLFGVVSCDSTLINCPLFFFLSRTCRTWLHL